MLLEAKTKYAKTTVNIRAAPNTESKIISQLYWNDKINVIKKVNKKWYQVKYKNKLRYLNAKYVKNSESHYTIYKSPSNNSFKSYEDADCITDNSSVVQGVMKQKYHMDYNTGVWMIGNRYCVALGSYYYGKIGTKIDLVLSDNGKEHILKCIASDIKSDKDTIDEHRIHRDGSVAEFVVKTKLLSNKARYTGDISYAGKKFKGKIVKIKVYKE